MFLDEELESICQDETICEEKSFMLFQACLKRIPKPNQETADPEPETPSGGGDNNGGGNNGGGELEG